MNDSRLTILTGDCLDVLRTLPEESVHCVVTSPPYWGLRDYGVPGQLGLEATPEEYVAKMVAVFREARRVLRNDGTCWVNLGDCYAHGIPGGGSVMANGRTDGRNFNKSDIPRGREKIVTLAPGLKPKDLCGIPWRVAFALQADGWWLRQDIIWHKPNPMPESVTDRCTKAHEYVFLLSKRERYFWDAEAVKEAANPESASRYDYNFSGTREGAHPPDDSRYAPKGARDFSGTRNKRSVWTVPSYAYPDAHFATYPPDLIKPCILAGTSARGCCPKCGAPWERIVSDSQEYAEFKKAETERKNGGMRSSSLETNGLSRGSANKSVLAQRETLGWQPTCECDKSATVPATVLDPFGGSGTTGMVALELGRRAILIELNPAYVELAERRCAVTPGLPLA